MSPFPLSLRTSTPPDVAVELAAQRVSAVRIETRGGRLAVAAHASEPLDEGTLVPSLTSPNILDRPFLGAALGRVLDHVGRPRRVGLVIPDPVAKVSLVRFESVPSRPQELDQLIRWQVRKAAPFPIEEAQISFTRGATAADGQEFIVSLARRTIVEEYEGLCALAGAHAGIVDISTFNVINAILADRVAPDRDWLLVNIAPEWASLAILRGQSLIFFRSRGADAEGTLADLVHQTAMYYEDRLQGRGFARVLLCGASIVGSRQLVDVEELRRSLEDRLSTAVDTVDSTRTVVLSDRLVASPALPDTLAPLVGLLVRGRSGYAA